VRAIGTSVLGIGGALLLTLVATPAAAGLPGSTQPGAQQVAPGNLIIIRNVPPRNAIIPGAGAAVTVPTAPPSIVFAVIQGVGAPLTDSQAASVTGSVSPGQGGGVVATAIGGVLGAQSMVGSPASQQGAGSAIGGQIGATVQSSVGMMSGLLGNLGGPGH
jgi:hypothetical protein